MSQAVYHSEDPLYPHELLRASVLVALTSDSADDSELSSATGGIDVVEDEDEDELLDEDLEDVQEEEDETTLVGGEVGRHRLLSFVSSCVSLRVVLFFCAQTRLSTIHLIAG